MNCTRPGCSGQIEDGYCNTCGLAPPEEAPMNCTRPGCSGQIEDGYCDTCGLAPAEGTRASTVSGRERTRGSIGETSSGTSIRPSTSKPGRGHLGAGLVEVPPVPHVDPLLVVLSDPQVSEAKRFCGKCGSPVGRRRGDRTGRPEGYCSTCGSPFSFIPKLRAGEVVAGQYRVAGCLAHGGLGWVYLAQDRNVSDRWVVLKGLLDTGDESAMAAAIAERRFLAQVEHPNTVRIYNFVEHGEAGYIVMEYVAGRSLKDLRRDGPLPAAQAIAYMVEALPALGYLHDHGLLYCDFKPDNVIQTEEQLKIIDLGGVRRADDEDSVLYGTVGYQAPEVPEYGPSVASDLYTVARSLAVLCFDFRGFQDPARYATSLPPGERVPTFGRYSALHRFLVKATDPEPERRFRTAGEMAEQLTGVLHMVLAIDGAQPRPEASRVFTPELGAAADGVAWNTLPTPVVDHGDPASGLLASLVSATPDQVLAALQTADPTPEVQFQRVRAALSAGDRSLASATLAARASEVSDDWRVTWWQGVLGLASGSGGGDHFEKVAAELPGELAPLLAMAAAQEMAGDLEGASQHYALVSATDPSFASASFGLARARSLLGDGAGAAAALQSIPAASSAFTPAQVALCRTLIAGQPSAEDLAIAYKVLGGLSGDPVLQALLERDVLIASLAVVQPDEEADVRRSLERAHRRLAKLAPSGPERIELVDRANAYRPRTLV